jgi:hypothetical protein
MSVSRLVNELEPIYGPEFAVLIATDRYRPRRAIADTLASHGGQGPQPRYWPGDLFPIKNLAKDCAKQGVPMRYVYGWIMNHPYMTATQRSKSVAIMNMVYG